MTPEARPSCIKERPLIVDNASVVTARISDLVIRLTTRPTFSPATQAMIERYATRDGERERCLRELSLVVANAVLVPALVVVAGLLRWLTAAEVGSGLLVVYA